MRERNRSPLWQRLQLLPSIALLSLAGLIHVGHRSLVVAPADATSPLPSAEALRVLSIGHRTTVADAYWLKWVQYLGDSERKVEWPHLEALTDLVVYLDPQFGYAYQSAGVVLASVDRLESSNRILEEGMRHVPDRWQLPFLAGFNAWHGLGDLKGGGTLLLRAASLPGSPRYLSDLAARLFSTSGSIQDGLDLLELSLRSADDPLIREELGHRRRQLVAEQALRRLEDEISAIRSSGGPLPASVEELNGYKGLSSEVASSMRYDSSSGAISSTVLPKRLVVYRELKVPAALEAPPALAADGEVVTGTEP